MKLLIILRHAKAEAEGTSPHDRDRPLTDEGKEHATLLGETLASEGVTPDILYTSPALRAFETARLVSEALNLPENPLKVEERLYNSNGSALLKLIQSTDYTIDALMLCGHNPGMEELCRKLLNENSFSMHTCEVAVIALDIDNWSDCRWGIGELEKYIPNPYL